MVCKEWKLGIHGRNEVVYTHKQVNDWGPSSLFCMPKFKKCSFPLGYTQVLILLVVTAHYNCVRRCAKFPKNIDVPFSWSSF